MSVDFGGLTSVVRAGLANGATSALALAAIHRRVGHLQQGSGLLGIAGVNRRADAGCRVDIGLIGQGYLRDFSQNSLANRIDSAGFVELGAEHDELIAAESADAIRMTGNGKQAGGEACST